MTTAEHLFIKAVRVIRLHERTNPKTSVQETQMCRPSFSQLVQKKTSSSAQNMNYSLTEPQQNDDFKTKETWENVTLEHTIGQNDKPTDFSWNRLRLHDTSADILTAALLLDHCFCTVAGGARVQL